jgi:hypothetical protein
MVQVDFSVVIVSTVVLVAESMNARFLKALRVLRAIKPLRLLSNVCRLLSQSSFCLMICVPSKMHVTLLCRVLTRSMSMLLVFHTLTRSLMEMGNVTVLCALCFLIFAILGVRRR